MHTQRRRWGISQSRVCCRVQQYHYYRTYVLSKYGPCSCAPPVTHPIFKTAIAEVCAPQQARRMLSLRKANTLNLLVWVTRASKIACIYCSVIMYTAKMILLTLSSPRVVILRNQHCLHLKNDWKIWMAPRWQSRKNNVFNLSSCRRFPQILSSHVVPYYAHRSNPQVLGSFCPPFGTTWLWSAR